MSSHQTAQRRQRQHQGVHLSLQLVQERHAVISHQQGQAHGQGVSPRASGGQVEVQAQEPRDKFFGEHAQELFGLDAKFLVLANKALPNHPHIESMCCQR